MPAPSGLSAKPTDGAVALSWSPVAAATGYSLLRSETAGGPYVQIYSGNAINFVDGDRANAVPEFYVVQTLHGRTHSRLSAEVRASAISGRQLCIAAPFQNAIVIVDATQNEEAPPLAVLGSHTTLANPTRIVVDESHGELFVADTPGAGFTVSVFDTKANGDVAPKRVLASNGTSIDIAIDEIHEELFVATAREVDAYDRAAHGIAIPKRIISSQAANAVAYSGASDEVATAGPSGILAFPRSGSVATAAARTIASSNAESVIELLVDDSRHELYVLRTDCRGPDIPCLSPSLEVYDFEGNNGAATRTLHGQAINGFALDNSQSELWLLSDDELTLVSAVDFTPHQTFSLPGTWNLAPRAPGSSLIEFASVALAPRSGESYFLSQLGGGFLVFPYPAGGHTFDSPRRAVGGDRNFRPSALALNTVTQALTVFADCSATDCSFASTPLNAPDGAPPQILFSTTDEVVAMEQAGGDEIAVSAPPKLNFYDAPSGALKQQLIDDAMTKGVLTSAAIVALRDGGIAIYPRNADSSAGVVAPLRVIAGDQTLLGFPLDIAVDDVRGEIDALTLSTDNQTSVLVFDFSDSGNVPPQRELVVDPYAHFLTVDSAHSEMFVWGTSLLPGIGVYDELASGAGVPKRTIPQTWFPYVAAVTVCK